MKTNAKLYVFERPDGVKKLGHSKDPEWRVREVGRDLEIVHTSEIKEQAELIERTAHRLLKLAGKHVRGEWFKITLDEALDAIERAERIADGRELPLQYRRSYSSGVAISLKLPPRLLTRVDAVRRRMPAQPTRTACMEAALDEWCQRLEGETDGKARKARK